MLINRSFFALALSFLLVNCSPYSQPVPGTLIFQLPGASWSLRVPLKGAEIIYNRSELQGDGQYIVTDAIIEPDWAVSVMISKRDHIGALPEAIEFMLNYIKAEKLRPSDFHLQPASFLSDFPGQLAMAEGFVAETTGIRIDQKSKYLVMYYDSIDVQLQVTKMHYRPEDEETFDKLFNSLEVVVHRPR